MDQENPLLRVRNRKKAAVLAYELEKHLNISLKKSLELIESITPSSWHVTTYIEKLIREQVAGMRSGSIKIGAPKDRHLYFRAIMVLNENHMSENSEDDEAQLCIGIFIYEKRTEMATYIAIEDEGSTLRYNISKGLSKGIIEILTMIHESSDPKASERKIKEIYFALPKLLYESAITQDFDQDSLEEKVRSSTPSTVAEGKRNKFKKEQLHNIQKQLERSQYLDKISWNGKVKTENIHFTLDEHYLSDTTSLTLPLENTGMMLSWPTDKKNKGVKQAIKRVFPGR